MGSTTSRELHAPTRTPEVPHLPLATSALAIAMACCGASGPVWGNPAGGVAAVGQATMTANGSQLLVSTQNGAGLNHSAINWQSFSIPGGSSTYFQQPSSTSTVINRVVSSTPTQIFGTLGSNGNVVLVNQSGITVGAGAVVDTAGFTASALRMSDADALTGHLRFGDSGGAAGGLSVQGSILARQGDVVLLGSRVETGQTAVVQAPNGATIVAAGQQVDITGRGLEGILLRVQAPTDTVLNLGTLSGDAVALFAGSLRHSGAIQANAVSVEGGKVVLRALQSVQVDGSIGAHALDGLGGGVFVTGAQVALESTALVDVRGAMGGGEALIGGGLHGQDARLANAQQTVVAPGARILADATAQGDGGTIVAWSEGVSAVHGSLSAQGAGHTGNGGQLETSGHYLDVSGIAVSASASGGGTAGTWLLDPYDITIVGTAADALPPPMGNLASYTGTANPSLLDASTVLTALSSGTNVTVETGGAGTGAGNITLASALNLSGTNHATLTLNAASDVLFNAGISATGGAALDLVVAAGRNIDLGSFGSVGLGTGGGSVRLNAATGSIGGYAGSVISSAGGNIFLSAANGDISLASISSNGQSLGSGNAGSAGAISLHAGYQVHVDSLTANGGFIFGTTGNGGNAGTIAVTAGSNCDCASSILTLSSQGGSGGYGSGVGGASGDVFIALGQSFNASSISANMLNYSNASGDIDLTSTTLALKSMTLSAGGNISATTSGLAQFSAASTGAAGSGSVNLTHTGALTIGSISVANGNVTVDNTGALTTTGAIQAGGSGVVSLTAHSPITIGAGGISATGAIALDATTVSPLSTIVLNGLVQSTGSSVSLSAYSGIAQNGFVSGAQGVTATSSAGLITFGFNGYSGGSPLTYVDRNGAVFVPQVPASVLVASLLSPTSILDVLGSGGELGPIYTDNPFAPVNRSKDALVVEGNLCTP